MIQRTLRHTIYTYTYIIRMHSQYTKIYHNGNAHYKNTTL
jgi:hypothetical protein